MIDSPPRPINESVSSFNDTLNRSAMPDEQQVLKEFDEVLKMTDLPADKIRKLRECTLDKKWALVCDRKMVTQSTSPSIYLENLRIYIDRNLQKKKFKQIGKYTPTELLKHIEISLRTNSIDWVINFLNEENNGLSSIIQYMYISRDCLSSIPPILKYQLDDHGLDLADSCSAGPKLKRKFSFSKHLQKQSDEGEDLHICVLGLRAIMNNKYGFNKVFNDEAAIYNLTRCILHPSLKTKALVAQLLSAICLVNDGHELVINAFTKFKNEYNEKRRFSTFFYFFRYSTLYNVDFLSSCMQLINVLANSVDNYNYRVSLQYEFMQLGLDEYLKELEKDDNEPLCTHLHDFRENFIEVSDLIGLPREINEMQQKIEHLEEDLSRSKEKNQQSQAEYLAYKGKLQAQINELKTQQEELIKKRDMEIFSKDKELENTRRMLTNLQLRVEEITNLKQSMEQELKAIQSKSIELITQNQHLVSEVVNLPKPPERKSVVTLKKISPPSPPPLPSIAKMSTAPPLQSPNLLNKVSGPPPPPPLAGLLQPQNVECKTLRKVLQPKNKLPPLTWSSLNANQVKGTVFLDLNDEKLHDKIDFSFLENYFKLNEDNLSVRSGRESPAPSICSTKENAITLLSNKRLQNFAITKRKIALSSNDLVLAIYRMDLKILTGELVDLLLPMIPTEEEIIAFKDYESKNNNNIDGLSAEDKFVATLISIERLSHKLKIMSFMASFDETVNLLKPAIVKLTAATVALKESVLFPKVLEVVLLFGNYLNGQKRGPAYGFRLSSLDTLKTLRSSTDNKLTLMHALCHVINDQLPQLTKFPEELNCLEPATTINLESIQLDVKQLETTFKIVIEEHKQKADESPETLKFFVERATVILEELMNDFKFAKDSFHACVELYGETTKSPSVFFTYILNFIKSYIQCSKELNERKSNLEKKNILTKPVNCQLNGIKEKNNALVNELNTKFNRRSDIAKKMKPSDIADGDFERLINNLKEGYLVADNNVISRTRKSLSPLRKQIESQIINRERV